jgi:hypothetical protein
MKSNLKEIISRNLVNFPGFRTNRQIVVFESDDWGSIRMPSKRVFDDLKNFGIPVDDSPYCKFDALESNSDMEILFDVLISFKDFKGNYPIITANTVVGNPDFEKIKQSDFKEYFYEPFTKTLLKYPNHHNVYDLYQQGIKENLFFPQFHGREHVNVELWMNLLRDSKDFKFAFSKNMWGLSNDVFPKARSIQATFDSEDEHFLKNSIIEGLTLFENLFGYKSKSFIANNFTWSTALEKILSEKGIKHLQGMKYQLLPKADCEKRKLIRHYLGDRNMYDQIYSVRNCSFEPSIDNREVDKTIDEVRNAFFWNKPAIISTHRINFIGSINLENQKVNINSFRLLLHTILKKWPDVEFLTTVDLDQLIRKNDA